MTSFDSLIGRTNEEPARQAERQAKWLSVWLSRATARSVATIPVLALPCWYVEGRAAGSVEIYSGRQLSRLLDRVPALMNIEVREIAHQLEQRCRNVAPTYRDEKAAVAS